MAEDKKKETKKMKKIPTAVKRQKQDEKKRLANQAFKSQIKTSIKKFLKTTTVVKTKEQLMPLLNKVYSLLDKAVKKKLFKKNKSNRLKSNITKKMLAAEKEAS